MPFHNGSTMQGWSWVRREFIGITEQKTYR
jgi:hypothetical protein